MKSRRLMQAFVVFVGVALVVGAWFVGSRVRSPREAAASAAAPVGSVLSSAVERRVLSATVIQRGDVRVGSSFRVVAPTSAAGSAVAAPVVTRQAVKPGDSVVEGGLVVVVSDRPVFVMQGVVPVFRDMRPGLEGSDVRALQAAFGRMGCDAGSDGVFSDAVKKCVSGLYTAAGFGPLMAGLDSDGLSSVDHAVNLLADAEASLTQSKSGLVAGSKVDGVAIASAQGAVNQAQRGVGSAEVRAASDVAQAQTILDAAKKALADLVAASSTTGVSSSVAPADVDAAQLAVKQAQFGVDAAVLSGQLTVADARDALTAAQAQLVAATAPKDVASLRQAVVAATSVRDEAAAALVRAQKTSGPMVPLGEVVFVPTLPAVVEGALPLGASRGAAAGSAGGSFDGGTGGPAPSTPSPSGSADAFVTLVTGGLHVDTRISVTNQPLLPHGSEAVLLDEVSGITYPAVLVSVDAAASAAADGSQGFAGTLQSKSQLPAELTGHNLRVTFTTASSGQPVLVVPVSAVSAGANGVARVEKLNSDGTRVTISVNAGLSADGSVAVTPAAGATLGEGDRVVIGVSQRGVASGG